jgi:hypothetical protein
VWEREGVGRVRREWGAGVGREKEGYVILLTRLQQERIRIQDTRMDGYMHQCTVLILTYIAFALKA